ncbi:MAG TPA: flagellar basal body P-ring formation protein FlgA [Chromatiales bacterium]|nr:flagellar basal body P-ring formation protein FlgA [Thiotrichales bacterium]HIP67744.1 flagellar basal body P-ring formation protein FlgA [Chromatiales bacterium]
MAHADFCGTQFALPLGMDIFHKPDVKFLSLSFLLIVACLLLSGENALAANAERQSHASIRKVAKHFILKELKGSTQLKVDVKQLDRRLKLTQCTKPLTAFWPPGARKAGHSSIGVRCEGNKPWKIFVQANIAILEKVAVLNRPVVRGDVLSMDMLRFENKDISRLGNRYVKDAEPLLGYRFKSPAGQEKLLAPRMLETPRMVRRGQTVTLLAEAGGIQVRMNGMAMSDGAKGKLVRVRNLGSKRIVEGEVIAKGTVKVRN